MNYSFLPEAEAEYIEAVRFYEEQQTKLGLSLILLLKPNNGEQKPYA